MSDPVLPGAGDSELAAAERATRDRLGIRAQLAQDALEQVMEAYDEWRESVLDLREIDGSDMSRDLISDGLDAAFGLGPGSWARPAVQGCRDLGRRLEHFSTGGDQGK